MRILVVEDDTKVGGFLEVGLREEMFEVDRACDGHEALVLAGTLEYDLILLDYMLPKKSGIEVASELRGAGRETPILMLTARDAPEDWQAAREAGVNALMGKPFRFAELLDRIRALIQTSPDPT
ncbi:MAG TPA: response regulator [Gemmatimonadales bacterium]|jgi:DNA-binding response OmpR family regulator